MCVDVCLFTCVGVCVNVNELGESCVRESDRNEINKVKCNLLKNVMN